jgi:hypothetical protein
MKLAGMEPVICLWIPRLGGLEAQFLLDAHCAVAGIAWSSTACSISADTGSGPLAPGQAVDQPFGEGRFSMGL